MIIVACAGYYRTGSSAITDLFAEFDCCNSLGSFEFRFIQDPDGVSDLEYNLVENNHRHNTSHAIKRYLRLVRFLNGTWYTPRYRKYFNDRFMAYSLDYVDAIVELTCRAWWHRDQIDRGSLFYLTDRFYAQMIGAFQEHRGNVSLLTNEPAYFTSISRKDFYKHTREYTRKLFSYANKRPAQFLIVDQLVPPSNISRYLNYFDRLKVIVVDRDPRDLYVLEKMIYKWGIIPHRRVEEFCRWYMIIRTHQKYDVDDERCVLRIDFEDLVYHYEDTCSKLVSFVGMPPEAHNRKKTVFVPEESRRNTQVFLHYPEIEDDILYIEEQLQEFLYNFPHPRNRHEA